MKAFIKKHWLYIVVLVLVAAPFAWAAGVKMMDLTAQSEAIVGADSIILNDDSDSTMSVDGTTKVATITQLQDFFEGATNTWTGTNTFSGTVNLPAAIDLPADSVDYADLNYKMSKDIVIEDPTDDDAWLIFKDSIGITITDIHCITDTGTAVIDVQECASDGTSCATVDATITCDSDGAEDDGSLSNGVIDAGDWVNLDIGTVASSPTKLTISIFY
jgi:hypothetical protein